MDPPPLSNDSIHGLPEYTDYQYRLNFAICFTIVPLFYIFPTVFIMIRVYWAYRGTANSLAKLTLDGSLFTLLISYFSTNILFFLADYIRFNLPSSGLLTSWCAHLQPNHSFKLILIITDYLNYCVIILPLMVTVIRVTILIFPNNHQQIRKNLMNLFILPFLFLVPFICVIFLFPALGYCKQLGPPFPFGSVYLYYSGSLFKLRSAYFLLFLSISICSASALLSTIMTCKLRTGTYQNASSYTRKLSKRAERSLSVTMISAIVPLTTNTIVSVTSIWLPGVSFNFYFLRSLGNDFETVMMPWVLYLTHPVFREKRKRSNDKVRKMWITSVSSGG